MYLLWIIFYFAYFNSIMSYGIIFWGASSHSINIFRLQKKDINTFTAKVDHGRFKYLRFHCQSRPWSI
jgi:hypothetical protein